ncbi:MAG: tRNA (adenosine(37)-N6)-threonylcarbamoyltransferase complex dimerization subunit type 1 TsaB [Cyanobacteria bacterium P01_H01_bin.121]
MNAPQLSHAQLGCSLALHTTTPQLGLVLQDAQGNQRQQILSLGRTMAAELHQHLARFIEPQTWQDLQYIAVARGPGGFTGTRLGLVTARTLAQQLALPLFSISTLAAFAWSQGLGQGLGQGLAQELDVPELGVVMQAQRGQLYVAVYEAPRLQGPPIATLAEQVVTPEQWQSLQKQWPRPLKIVVVGENLAASVGSLLAIAHLSWQQGHRPHWSEALPFYGQSPVKT